MSNKHRRVHEGVLLIVANVSHHDVAMRYV